MLKYMFNVLVVSTVLALPLSGAKVVRAQDTASQASTSTATAATIAAFKTNPTAWLASTKNSSTLLSVQARDLVLADHTQIHPMVTLAKSADPLPKANIGVGLAQAALQFVKNNDTADSSTIQQEIALAGDDALFRSFTAGSNPVETASLGLTGTSAPGTTDGGVGTTATTSTTGTTGTTTSTTTTGNSTSGTPNTTPTFSTSATIVTPTSFSTTTGSTFAVSTTR